MSGRASTSRVRASPHASAAPLSPRWAPPAFRTRHRNTPLHWPFASVMAGRQRWVRTTSNRCGVLLRRQASGRPASDSATHSRRPSSPIPSRVGLRHVRTHRMSRDVPELAEHEHPRLASPTGRQGVRSNPVSRRRLVKPRPALPPAPPRPPRPRARPPPPRRQTPTHPAGLGAQSTLSSRLTPRLRPPRARARAMPNAACGATPGRGSPTAAAASAARRPAGTARRARTGSGRRPARGRPRAPTPRGSRSSPPAAAAGRRRPGR